MLMSISGSGRKRTTMSKDNLPTKKDIAWDLVRAIRLLKHIDGRLETCKTIEPEKRQALIDDLRLMVLDYLKDR